MCEFTVVEAVCNNISTRRIDDNCMEGRNSWS